MIGQKHKSSDALTALRTPERPRLNPRAASFSAASDPPLGEPEPVSASEETETSSKESRSASPIMSPYEDRVEPVGSADLTTPKAYAPETETLEDLAEKDPDLAETLSEIEKDWPSPSTDDSGLHARTWVSPFIAEYERWQVVKNSLRSMELIPRSPFVPRTFLEWLIHRQEMKEINIRNLNQEIEDCKARAALGKDREHVNVAFGGKRFGDGNSGVLALETVWTLLNDSAMNRARAPWPCQQEMKEEGDERNTSGFGRFPALPRAVANETVNYKHRAVVAASPLDSVWPVPPAEQLDDGVGESEDAIGKALLGENLWAALDE